MFLLYYLVSQFPVVIHLKKSPMFAITKHKGTSFSFQVLLMSEVDFLGQACVYIWPLCLLRGPQQWMNLLVWQCHQHLIPHSLTLLFLTSQPQHHDCISNLHSTSHKCKLRLLKSHFRVPSWIMNSYRAQAFITLSTGTQFHFFDLPNPASSFHAV